MTAATKRDRQPVMAIDPGPVNSALLVYDGAVVHHGIYPNHEALDILRRSAVDDYDCGYVAIEMIASYGMAVGKTVFETCVWIGRFLQVATDEGLIVSRVFRKDVKLHVCGQTRAKDANIRQALIDRFGPGKELAIGKKKTPGPLYGIKGDEWAALAVAVTWSDQRRAPSLRISAQPPAHEPRDTNGNEDAQKGRDGDQPG